MSSMPIYSHSVAKVLHPPLPEDAEDGVLIGTHMLANPIPDDFSEESIKLLQTLKDTNDNDLLVTTPVHIILWRKWNKYGYIFYLYQFFLFVA